MIAFRGELSQNSDEMKKVSDALEEKVNKNIEQISQFKSNINLSESEVFDLKKEI